ncbi:MAG: hypothetical protein IT364_26920 [Candidatus Hydrogenedentes bacterium]|nr:hypothetical protein [Candidatus Hydrogenedentota bacterium]
MNRTLYEETQRFAVWVYIVTALTMSAVIVGQFLLLMNPPRNGDPLPPVVPVITIVVTIIIANLLYMRVRVRENDVYAQLGFLFPMMWRRIGFDKMQEYRVVQYKPLREAGGWGIRFGMFEGKPASFVNARGDRGVLLISDKRPLIISSQDPERLAEAIARAREVYQQARG